MSPSSYSDVTNLIETQGYDYTFQFIYQGYKKAKIAVEELEEQLRKAKNHRDEYSTAAHHFMKRAANEDKTLEEEDGHVVRLIVDKEVVHFRVPYTDGQQIFIGYWQLSTIVESL